MNDFVELENFLKSENEKVRQSIPEDIYTVKAMIQIVVRTMDVFYSQHYKGNEDNNSTLYELGYTKALNFLIGPAIETPGWITTPTNETIWNWANAFIVHCGKIALTERYQIYVKAGIVHLSYEAEARKFCFQYRAGDVDIEQVDRQAANWYKQLINNGFSKPNLDLLLNKYEPVRQKLFQIVQPWLGHMISYLYDDPVIDEYYQKLAYYRSASMLNQDLFPPDSKFNGIPYAAFRDFAELTMAVSIKHKDFCGQLIKKNPATNILDIISLFRSRTDSISNAAAFLNQSPETVAALVDSLTLFPENRDYHVNREVSPAPPFIQIGGDSLIQSAFGCEGNPYYFMNNELKRAYPKDYFNAVNDREKYFRDELYMLFNSPRYVTVHKSVVIKIKNVHTDIDAAVLHPESGTLAIFQLKWQDPFGKSMKERYSRIKNFYPKTIEWIEKVIQWLNDNDSKLILASLGLDNTVTINKALLFVVNRNAANFSGYENDKRAAWTSWYRLLNSASRLPVDCPNELKQLYQILTEKISESKEPETDEKYEFDLSDRIIEIKSATSAN
ncbi:hypothetical protein AAFN85_03540 [Mucilaginibacter sp. CAU 1740]|uniref:hypothetical protein n=1 Tax=Mucilaginibacter sp. CAU 1740 TaxID=3140365 RepID=UPI00325BF726